MSKNYVRVPLIGTEPENFEPNVAELNHLLPQVGFRPLTDATQETMPVGSVVVIYNCNNHTLFPGVVISDYTLLGFNYTTLPEIEKTVPESFHLSKKYDFQDKLYKVILNLDAEDFAQKGSVKNALQGIGFSSLEKATSEDLPEGSLVLLSTDTGRLAPVITRTLSMKNKRFLFWSQSPIVAGDWHPNVIMDHLTPFENTYYWVVS